MSKELSKLIFKKIKTNTCILTYNKRYYNYSVIQGYVIQLSQMK